MSRLSGCELPWGVRRERRRRDSVRDPGGGRKEMMAVLVRARLFLPEGIALRPAVGPGEADAHLRGRLRLHPSFPLFLTTPKGMVEWFGGEARVAVGEHPVEHR